MPGGKHAVNKSYTYKPRLSRAHKKKVIAAKAGITGGIVKRKRTTAVVIPSNIEKSNKKRSNRGLARAIEKLKASGALNKQAVKNTGAAATGSVGKKALDVDGDVEMKEAEHEIIVTKKANLKAPKKGGAAAKVDTDSMDVDVEPSAARAKRTMRRSTRRITMKK